MRVISTTGYFASGSSAITDLMREYSSVEEPGGCDFEISFFFGYHGLLNLLYWLVDQKYHQRLAVNDFWEEAKFRARFGTRMNYQKYFDGSFLEITSKYLDQIHGTSCGEKWFIDWMKLSGAQVTINRVINKFYSVSNEIYNSRHTDRREKSLSVFGKKENNYLYDISEEDFLNASKQYLHSLFSYVRNGKDIVFADGLIGTHNIDDISKFFDDLRLTVVDRDPRDVYLSDMYVNQNYSVPKDVEKYCEWFRLRHTSYSCDNSNVLFLHFEDMIYDYENTVKQIEEFFGVSSKDHIFKEKFFIPDRSRNNTRLWEKYPQECENMRYIEEHLSQWIYRY